MPLESLPMDTECKQASTILTFISRASLTLEQGSFVVLSWELTEDKLQTKVALPAHFVPVHEAANKKREG